MTIRTESRSYFASVVKCDAPGCTEEAEGKPFGWLTVNMVPDKDDRHFHSPACLALFYAAAAPPASVALPLDRKQA